MFLKVASTRTMARNEKHNGTDYAPLLRAAPSLRCARFMFVIPAAAVLSAIAARVA